MQVRTRVHEQCEFDFLLTFNLIEDHQYVAMLCDM